MADSKPPQSDSPKGVLYRLDRTTTIAIVAFVIWTLPIGLAQAWPAFVRDKTIPEWLAERRWPGMTPQLYGWLTILFFIVLIVLVLIRTRRKEVSTQADASIQKAPLDEDQTKRIEELEGKNRGLENRWKEHLFSNSWLLNKAGEQAQGIRSHVEVEKVYFCYQELETPMLKSVFGIDFRNQSVFDVSIENKVGGCIEVNGMPLAEPPHIISPSGIVATGKKGSITLEQRLTRAEADYIASKDLKSIEFNLTKLLITIKGERVAPRDGQYLEIPKRLYIDPQAEIASLKSEIASQVGTITTLETERASLKAQIEERDKHKLILEVDTGLYMDGFEPKQSGVIIQNGDFERYIVKPYFRVRFWNHAPHKLTTRSVKVFLMRKTENGEEVVPSISSHVDNQAEEVGIRRRFDFDNFTVEGGTPSERIELLCDFELTAKQAELLDENCFLRISMEAMNQAVLNRDFDVDWKKAFTIFETLTPRN
jgi:preprotein translocase subunit SecG